jgi:hypothetical protein
MKEADLMVDGIALAGVLGEVFVHEMTSARVACEGCGDSDEPLVSRMSKAHFAVGGRSAHGNAGPKKTTSARVV